jgi:hypothetical protein
MLSRLARRVIEVHGRQALHLPLGEVESDTGIKPGHGAEHKAPACSVNVSFCPDSSDTS